MAEAARLLRQAHHLGPDAQQRLAELAEEMGKALDGHPVSSAEMSHLADTTASLVHALHKQHDTGLLSDARDRMERAIIAAEVQAPVATGVARRLLDALANIGI